MSFQIDSEQPQLYYGGFDPFYNIPGVLYSNYVPSLI